MKKLNEKNLYEKTLNEKTLNEVTSQNFSLSEKFSMRQSLRSTLLSTCTTTCCYFLDPDPLLFQYVYHRQHVIIRSPSFSIFLMTRISSQPAKKLLP